MPVSSEICAFHPSTGSGARYWSDQPRVAAIDLLLRERQVDAAALEFAQPRADCRPRRAGATTAARTRVDLPLHGGVVELRPAQHPGPVHVDPVHSPVASRSIVQSTAGRTCSGSRLAAPSLSTVGCRGVR